MHVGMEPMYSRITAQHPIQISITIIQAKATKTPIQDSRAIKPNHPPIRMEGNPSAATHRPLAEITDNMNNYSVILILSLMVGGCTSVTVRPLEASYNVKHICIKENPKVEVDDFMQVIVDALNRHNIKSEFIALSTTDKAKVQNDDESFPDQYYMDITPAPDSCDFNLTYTARRSWDFVTYLSTADIAISDKNSRIAHAHYHLRRKGGLSLFKWQGVKTKIDPVMDELLIFYK